MSIYTNTSSIFQITALIAGKLITKTMRLQGRLEDVARRITMAIPEAESVTVEHVEPAIIQNDRRRNAGYDHACHDENHGMQNALL